MREDLWQESIDKAVKLLQPGTIFRLFFYKGNLNNYRGHVLAIVDEEHIVIKRWARSKQRWWYFVEHASLFSLYIHGGALKIIKRASTAAVGSSSPDRD